MRDRIGIPGMRVAQCGIESNVPGSNGAMVARCVVHILDAAHVAAILADRFDSDAEALREDTIRKHGLGLNRRDQLLNEWIGFVNHS